MRNVFHLKIRTILYLTIIVGMFSGCTFRQQHYSSSVVDYLYPNTQVVQKPSIPNLQLPLKVGIAFVPSYDKAISEHDKIVLLKNVAKKFKQHAFVKSIEIIPSAYLQAKGSFTNLDQIRTMHDVDVIALVSYDQKQFTDEGITSLAYWTIIGAYIIPGEKNDTHTMLDVVVYDIKSRKMLFRAPGLSHVKGSSTPINLSEELRHDQRKSFDEASKDLVINLNKQLEMFKQKVKESPEQYKITHIQGYKGGGSVDFLIVFFTLSIGVYGLWTRKRRTV